MQHFDIKIKTTPSWHHLLNTYMFVPACTCICNAYQLFYSATLHSFLSWKLNWVCCIYMHFLCFCSTETFNIGVLCYQSFCCFVELNCIVFENFNDKLAYKINYTITILILYVINACCCNDIIFILTLVFICIQFKYL